MLVAHFDKMSIMVPMKDNETIEEVEDRIIEAINSAGEGITMSYNLIIEEYE